MRALDRASRFLALYDRCASDQLYGECPDQDGEGINVYPLRRDCEATPEGYGFVPSCCIRPPFYQIGFAAPACPGPMCWPGQEYHAFDSSGMVSPLTLLAQLFNPNDCADGGSTCVR